MEQLEVILKVTERCNINCTYCYFFNAGDNSYLEHDKIISIKNVNALCQFLNEGVKDLNINNIAIDLHGGEPLIMSKNHFDNICSLIRSLIVNANVDLRLQTNAILIDNDWIKLFNKHNISVSTSLDGMKEQNDKNRVDFKGRGTYDRTIDGLRKLQLAAEDGLINEPGVICVIDPSCSPITIYNHFVNDLKIRSLEFLLPDYNYNTKDLTFSSEDYGNFLSSLYSIWILEDNPAVQVRILNSITSLFLGGRSLVSGFGKAHPNVITISSNGDIGPDDTLRACATSLMDYSLNINTSSLKKYFESSNYAAIIANTSTTPDECSNCCWLNICGGGHPVHRFKSNSFDNPSIYCLGLKKFYAQVCNLLIKKGVPISNIYNVLIPETSIET